MSELLNGLWSWILETVLGLLSSSPVKPLFPKLSLCTPAHIGKQGSGGWFVFGMLPWCILYCAWFFSLSGHLTEGFCSAFVLLFLCSAFIQRKVF